MGLAILYIFKTYQEAKEELKKLQELNGYADLMILKEKDGSYSIYLY